MRDIINEIKRRNVHRVAIAYLAGSWLLVQILETVFPIYGLDESGIRWIILLLIIGFIPALVLSWAFEWSSAGIQIQKEIDRDPDAKQSVGRTLDRIIIGVLALAVLFFAVDKFLTDPSAVPATSNFRTIAVLPFDDMTAAQDQAYFADGLAEELLNLLAKNPALRVAARTSSFSFRDAALPIGEIASQLGVTHVLEGSVRRDGDRIRVAAQLVAAHDGYHVWSEIYDESFGDIFSIQDRISSQIATALEANVLGNAPNPRQTVPEAYALYLQAKYLARQGSRESFEQAVAFFQEAIVIDPEYAPAWAYLANVYISLAGQGLWDWDEGFNTARDAARRAVEVDPTYSIGHQKLAWISHRFDGDLAAATEHMQKALHFDSLNVELLRNAAVLLLQIGKLDKAIAILEYCASRSPVDPGGIFNLGVAYVYANRLTDAERSFRKVLQLSPNYNGATYYLGETLLLTDRAEEALHVWQQLENFNLAKGTALATYALEQQEESDEALAELIAAWGEEVPGTVADVYAYRGEIDLAFEWLEKDYQKFGAAGWGELKQQRLIDNLRADPRWLTFLERAAVSDEQLSRYFFEVAIPSR